MGETHRLKTITTLPLGLRETFAFFSNASNLEKITPPELCFHILTPQPIEITEGTEIDYRLRLFGVPLNWRSRITNWYPPYRFVDEQILGPYKLWVHIHRFHEQNGSTTIMDEVWYQLPFWPLGEVVYPLVSGQLRRIFRFRKQAIWKLLCGECNRSKNDEARSITRKEIFLGRFKAADRSPIQLKRSTVSMKIICSPITFVFLVVLMMANVVDGKEALNLMEYQWKNRLLLLFSPSVDGPEYVKLKKDLSRQDQEVLDRDLLIFHILQSGETKLGNSPLPESSGNALREKFSIKSGIFTVLLIGKDGGVKLRREGRMEVEEIFSVIDTMPMRQREMREKSRQR